MKRMRKIALLCILLIGIPFASYPFTTISESTFDFGVYAGYGEQIDVTNAGTPVGIFGGIGYGITFIRAGFHIYSENVFLGNFVRTSMGLQGRFQLSIPILPVEPYAKVGFAFMDVLSDAASVERVFFASYLYGGGIEISAIPFIKPFAEYVITNSSWKNKDVKNYSVNFGVKLSM
jgi:hypothetical protein